MLNKKYKIIALLLGFSAVVCLGFLWVHRVTAPQLEVEHTASSTDWLTYHDPKFNFRIDYPHDLSVIREDQYIGFVDVNDDGPGGTGSSIFIEPTSFRTPEEAVSASNKKSREDVPESVPDDQLPATIIDGQIMLNGYTGIVVHYRFDGFDRPLPKSVMFIKNGFLFTISDPSEQYQRTWDSFHFEE